MSLEFRRLENDFENFHKNIFLILSQKASFVAIFEALPTDLISRVDGSQ